MGELWMLGVETQIRDLRFYVKSLDKKGGYDKCGYGIFGYFSLFMVLQLQPKLQP